MKDKDISDLFILPYGKYKGEKIANVPANYLLWLADEGKAIPQIKAYVEENRELLEKENRGK